MKTASFIVLVALLASASASVGPAEAQKSALDHFQFDGVSSDAELKDQGHTRREWIESHPVQAEEYWRAWDCKDRPCDSKWNANIRAKAAKIERSRLDRARATNSRNRPNG